MENPKAYSALSYEPTIKTSSGRILFNILSHCAKAVGTAALLSTVAGCSPDVNDARPQPEHPECAEPTLIDSQPVTVCLQDIHWDDNGGQPPGALSYNVVPSTQSGGWMLIDIDEFVTLDGKKVGSPKFENRELFSNDFPRRMFGAWTDLGFPQATEKQLHFQWAGTEWGLGQDDVQCHEKQCTGSIVVDLPPAPPAQ